MTEVKETGESTLTFLLRIGFERVPAVRYTIYMILKKVSEMLRPLGNLVHTTSRVFPVIFASYMGSSVLGPVSDF